MARYIIFPISEKEELVRLQLETSTFKWIFDVQLTETKKADYHTYFDTLYCDGNVTVTYFDQFKKIKTKSWIIYSDVLPEEKIMFHEPRRPFYHFTNSRGWINDPNGLVRKNNYYHMFYQANPFACRGFDKGWGHAKSKNLFDWEILPPALSADENGYSISGSTLFDEQGRGDFGKDAWIMMYSSRIHLRPDLGQKQNIAFSNDGKIFTKYKNNPIITDDSGPDFRDPKVFWFAEKKYFIMLVTFGSELRFYKSNDLIKWSYISTIDDSQFNPDHKIYECPELLLYEIDGISKWVLSFSWIENRSVNFVFGNFDGIKFEVDKKSLLQRADYGKDFYAAVAWDSTGEMEGRKLWIAWMCHFYYAADLPSDEGWLGMFTVPRDMTLSRNSYGNLIIRQTPAIELEELITETKVFNIIPNTLAFPVAFRLKGTFSNLMENNLKINFQYRSGENVTTTIDIKNNLLLVDRSNCNAFGIEKKFNDFLQMPINPTSNTTFTILGDKNSLEFYFDEGEHCMSLICLPKLFDGRIEFSGNFSILDKLELSHFRRANWKY